MNEFSELDYINRMYEDDIDCDRHFDETLVEKKRRSNMIIEDINSGWEIFNQMPTGLKMTKIIDVVGDKKWRDFLDDDIPDDASEFGIVDKAIKRFESELSAFFAVGII